jgi:hypothetical protein
MLILINNLNLFIKKIDLILQFADLIFNFSKWIMRLRRKKPSQDWLE